MISTWQDITQVAGADLSTRIGTILAQSPSLSSDGAGGFGNATQTALTEIGKLLPSLLGAVAILFIGWLVAFIAKAIVQGLLSRTNIDNRIASGLTGSDSVAVEKLISSLVFWVVLLITVVAVLDTLQLRVASQPLNSFLNQIGEFLPKLLGAGILLGVAWLVATLVKSLTVNALRALQVDERLNSQQDTTGSGGQLSIAETIGSALYWFIFLLFLMPVLDTLGLQQALEPVNTLVSEILAILPNILGAVIIGTVGWFAANIIRRIVTNLLATTGVDHLGSRFGLSQNAGGQSLSSILGTIVYVLVLIPVAIAALNTLQIQAISVPAIAMLQQVLNAIPLIFTAGAILTVAYFLGRFLSEVVTSILTSIGFNNIFSILGLPALGRTTAAAPEEETNSPTARTPSEVVGIVVFIGIMLFAAVAAINILNIPALTALVTGIVIILGRILSGLIVFGLGLFLANLAFKIITSSGNPQARILGQVARISIIVLISAMALQQIGVAPDIVNLAFGLLLGALAVAIALSFGLGSRDIAKDQVQQWLNSFKSKG